MKTARFNALDALGETVIGVVAINPSHVAAVFQQTGKDFSSIVLSNGIGYQVPHSRDIILIALEEAS